MREFFRGWKRKTGAVTLVVACLLTGAWVRSLTYVEQYISINSESSFDMLESENGAICLLCFRNGVFSLPGGWSSSASTPDPERNRRSSAKVLGLKRIGWDFLWFATGGPLPDQTPTRMYFVHYGVPVIPLVLISTCLLLAKPRPKPIVAPQKL